MPVFFRRLIFTFHHVSIKTQMVQKIHQKFINSHSTMYLLKLHLLYQTLTLHMYSHSIMYLLKPSVAPADKRPRANSHSTMYLLKQGRFQKL